MAWTRETELAWAAGFFDGEGSISAVTDKRRRQTVTVSLTVVQSGTADRPPDTLLRLRNTFGVGTLRRRAEHGTRLGTKPLWDWRVYTDGEVRRVIALLLPYLGTAKKDQIAAAIAIRTEYAGLAADRAMFCKRGHAITEQGRSVRRRRCWVCHNDYSRDFKSRRRAMLASAKGVV